MTKPGELVTRDELRSRLWSGDTFVDFNHGLNAAVNKLRDALSDSAEAPRYVETLPRRGYRFIAPVTRQSPAAVAIEAAPSKIEAEAASPAGEKIENKVIETKVPKARGRRFYLAVAGVLVASLVVAFSILPNGSRSNAGNEFSGQRFRTLTELADETSEPAFSSDGNYIAFHR